MSFAYLIVDLKGLRDTLLYLAEIIGIAFLLLGAGLLAIWVVFAIVWLLKGGNQITVLPFEIAAGESKYSGRAFADLFLAEWRRIYFYH